MFEKRSQRAKRAFLMKCRSIGEASMPVSRIVEDKQVSPAKILTNCIKLEAEIESSFLAEIAHINNLGERKITTVVIL